MMELIRNCSHDNENATYLVADSTVKKIIKVADSVVGISSLERELEGWEWYCRLHYPQRVRPLCRILQKNISYLRIEIEFINGIKNDYREGLVRNGGLLKKVMLHYRNIWPYYPNGYSVLHGDLSVDNIIYNEDGICVIDWEYFNLKGAPWGFDALYLLFETLYFGMRTRKQPFQWEVDIIVDSINILNRDNQLSVAFVQSPLKSVKDFIVISFKCWGEYLLTPPKKLPVVFFTDEQINSIDQAIVNRMKRKL